MWERLIGGLQIGVVQEGGSQQEIPAQFHTGRQVRGGGTVGQAGFRLEYPRAQETKNFSPLVGGSGENSQVGSECAKSTYPQRVARDQTASWEGTSNRLSRNNKSSRSDARKCHWGRGRILCSQVNITWPYSSTRIWLSEVSTKGGEEGQGS